MLEEQIHTQTFGPWQNHWGYELSFAVIDDLLILKAVTPDRKKIVRYYFDEDKLARDIDLLNQDRRF
jgi:hypothetical protein